LHLAKSASDVKRKSNKSVWQRHPKAGQTKKQLKSNVSEIKCFGLALNHEMLAAPQIT